MYAPIGISSSIANSVQNNIEFFLYDLAEGLGYYHDGTSEEWFGWERDHTKRIKEAVSNVMQEIFDEKYGHGDWL